jgi:hypothetical protein
VVENYFDEHNKNRFNFERNTIRSKSQSAGTSPEDIHEKSRSHS